MTPVDFANLKILVGGSDSRLVGTKSYQPPTQYDFPTPLDAVRHLAENADHENQIRSAFEELLKPHSTVKKWKTQRENLPATPHFAKYRHNKHYDKYHAAARACASGSASTEEQSLVSGLSQEIKNSKVSVPAGQILFHGCANSSLSSSLPYPTFISTTLIPTVAYYHAKKRGIQTNTKPIVYILTAIEDLKAIWGNSGNLVEWELLLDRGLTCKFIRSFSQQHFDIIEASISN